MKNNLANYNTFAEALEKEVLAKENAPNLFEFFPKVL